MFDIIIIGSGPAGLSAAIYAKRANLNVAVAEKEYEGTGQIAESGNVNNYLGLPNINGYDLGEKFREHAVSLDVEFIEKEAVQIEAVQNGEKEESAIYRVKFDDDTIAEARALIYTAGAYPRRQECRERMSIPVREYLTAQSVTEHSIKERQPQCWAAEIPLWMMHYICPIYVRRSIWFTEETASEVHRAQLSS